MSDQELATINVTTLISNRDQSGRVHIEGPGVKLQLIADDARALAGNIAEAATFAEADAFLFAFARQTIGADVNAAAVLLSEFREFREARIGPRPEVPAMAEESGRVNQYVCRGSRGVITTANLVEGTTPFLVECRAKVGCTGMMESQFYRVDQSLAPGFEWFRPSLREAGKLGNAMVEHVKAGGLDLRPATPTAGGRD